MASDTWGYSVTGVAPTLSGSVPNGLTYLGSKLTVNFSVSLHVVYVKHRGIVSVPDMCEL